METTNTFDLDIFVDDFYIAMDKLLDMAEEVWAFFGVPFITLVVFFVIAGALYKFILSPYLSGSGSSDKATRRKK